MIEIAEAFSCVAPNGAVHFVSTVISNEDELILIASAGNSF